MLKHLYIKSYALISELDLDLNNGFTVITGETGAGKSILLGALNLVLGGRADTKAISEGQQKCIIEAEFDLSSTHLEQFFSANDLDYSAICTIRREISTAGKSRSFINDTPVAVAILKELSNQLIDIHSQHENLLLQDNSFQLGIVDSVAQNAQILTDYQHLYGQYRTTEKQLADLQEQIRKQQTDNDYILFQYNQLVEARLQADELDCLEQEEQTLLHAEDIRTALSAVGSCMEEDNTGILVSLKEAVSQFRKIESFLPANQLSERLQSAYIELKDIAEETNTIAERTDYDPKRLQTVQERLDLLHTLLQKHHKTDMQELIGLREELGKQISSYEHSDEELQRLQQVLQQQYGQLQKVAKQLSQTRQAVKTAVETTLQDQLLSLGIRHARVELQITDTEQFRHNGTDDIQFLFAANKNQALHNVADVASGGEIARLMLCIKSLIADKQGLSTIIFDEIDTGVSGEIANRMGEIMQEMGKHRQVISITHLPQIAAKGNAHFKVFKQDTATSTETHISQLTAEQRIREIAQMLSGEAVTDIALANARQLLQPDTQQL